MLTKQDQSTLVMYGIVALIAYGGYRYLKAEVGEAVDITSDQNIAHRAVSSLTDTGSIGSTVYDWLRGGRDAELTAPYIAPNPTNAAQKTGA